MKKLFLIPLLFVLLNGCKGHNTEAYKVAAIELAPPPVAAADNAVMDQKADPHEEMKEEAVGNADVAETTAKPVKQTEKKIIKEGQMRFETGDIKQTRTTIIASLKKLGGYVSEENEYNSGDENQKIYVLKTRIPAKSFENFLSDVSSTAAQIDSKNIAIKDVTTQYIDISTRLQNKKLLEARYLALLKQANKMGDILQVENKLSEIRSEIESEQGQLNYLSRQVAYSSLDITFYTRHIAPVDKGYGVGYKLKRALGDGWDTLGSWFFGLISIWPLLLIVAVLIILFKRWRKRRKAAKA